MPLPSLIQASGVQQALQQSIYSNSLNKSVPITELKATVDTFVHQILENSQQTIAAMKNMYEYGTNHSLKDGLE